MILLTGGLGFIGSHTAVSLINSGFEIIIIDNLYNTNITVLESIKKIVTKPEKIHFYQGDMLNLNDIEYVFKNYQIDSVIHFASLKSVGESVQKPLLYYNTNLKILFNLLEIMEKYNCNKIIFSSSCTVYGSSIAPFDEKMITGIGVTCPYGQTKYFQEEILKDICKIKKNFTAIILRYFNPAGAHESGLIGELPNDTPNNLLPYILKVAIGKKNELEVYGGDYNTNDGSCIRDYIHVMDVADGHVITLQKCSNGLHIYNLGCGKGTSVLEMIKTFENVNNIKIAYKIIDRRYGDIETSYGLVDKIYNELGWFTKKDITNICKDGYNFIKNNI